MTEKTILASDLTSPTCHKSYSVIQGFVKILTRDFATTDHPLLKPVSPKPTGVRGQGNPKSFNLP